MRTVLLLAGIAPALLAVGLVLKVGVMMTHDDVGRGLFDDGEYTAAAEEFAANRSWNWFEPWVAPFNQGAALHADGDHDAAIAHYRTALDAVPEVDECLVRTNLALAHEALGDIAQQGPPPDIPAAIEDWEAGLQVLVDGECAVEPSDPEPGTDQAATRRTTAPRAGHPLTTIVPVRGVTAENEPVDDADQPDDDGQRVADRLHDKLNADTDEDGISDRDELSGAQNDRYGNRPTDPADPDSDGDGLADGQELEAGTDPNQADTDGGGASDGQEVTGDGTDPLDRRDDKPPRGNGGGGGQQQSPQEKELEERNQQGQDRREEEENGGGPRDGEDDGGEQDGGREGRGGPGGAPPEGETTPSPTW